MTKMPAYIAVTAAYWAFMLTDGALRMLVLLHFHTLGFSPVQLAYLFVFYELAGIVTNLCAGWIASRFGLTSTLYGGLALQIGALLAFTQLDPSWGVFASVIFAMAVQGVSGVAKDLTKMSAKSAVKLLAPDKSDSLFKWVAVLTGSKNAIKGLGFLLGAALLAIWGFYVSVLGMAAVLFVILVAVLVGMPPGLPGGIKGAKFKDVFSTSPQVNWLSLARVFLFGARDVWFVVGIPVYFYAVLSDGSEAGNRMAFFTIGSFMAAWTILYGFVQGIAPKILGAQETVAYTRLASRWVALLVGIPVVLALAVYVVPTPTPILTIGLIAGLLLFGGVFAVNSSLHSFLILAFTTGQRVTMDVGFYYMANAAGRLLGTVLSGLAYQFGGVAGCLLTASLLLALSWLGTRQLVRTIA
jgi:MFS family permease